jgi:hypothetical protein
MADIVKQPQEYNSWVSSSLESIFGSKRGAFLGLDNRSFKVIVARSRNALAQIARMI